MIDWVSCSLPYDGPPVGAQYFKRETFDAPIEPAFSKPVKVEGSYSSTMQVHAIGGRLYLHGNPVKWLTGQNVAGSNDLARLLAVTVDRLLDLRVVFPCPTMMSALDCGNVKLTRVDCTFSYLVGSDGEVVSWLEAMERACNVRYRGRGHFDQGMCSLAWGYTQQEGQKSKGSRRSSFKFYNKWREMAAPGHAPTCHPDVAAELREDVKGAVRGEACYRGIELQRLGKDKLSAWTQDTARELHTDWTGKMEMAETYTLKDEQVKELPRHLRATYRVWAAGVDVRVDLNRQTFWRHRRELMALGIDISQPLKPQDSGKVIPILRILEAKPVPENRHEALFWRLVAKAA